MPDGDDQVEVPDEVTELSREEVEQAGVPLSDPSKAKEGTREGDDPDRFAELEVEAAEEILAEEERDDDSGGAAPISRHQQRALALALTQKGIRETPPGSNVNIYSKYFAFGAQFWCADFVAWSLDRTGNQDKKVPWGYPSRVENITAWGKAHGKVHGMPQKGDIFTRKDGMHTGWVVSAQGTSFSTIEGNTDGPDGKVVWVAPHARDAGDGLYFFIRHHWE